MTKLSDTQAIILSSAGQRGSGSILPLPGTLKPGGGAAKAIAALAKHGLIEERETGDQSATSRMQDERRIGLFITEAGKSAIGMSATDAPANAHASGDGVAAPTPKAERGTKAAIVLDLLYRPDGATLTDLITATGWLPHTTRAALTGLRKKGHEVARGKRDGVTFYAVAAK